MKIKNIFILTIFAFFFFASFSSLYAQEVPAHADIVDSMAVLVLQLGIIIFAAKAGGVLFNKLKLPTVVGEIVAGIIISPYFLGGIKLPGLAQGFFPLYAGFPVSIELYGISTIASIILLFIVGLETDIDTLFRFSLAGSFIALFGAILSFVLGDLAGVLFSKYVFGLQYGFGHPVPLFLGIISTATSVGVTARTLSDSRKLDSPEGITIISAAVIDDVIGIIVLAIIIGICKSGQVAWKQVCFISLKAIIIWLGFTVVGITFARQLSGLLKKFKDKAAISIISLALALFLAGIFERSGLAMIIGAYVMGLSLSKTDLSYIIQENLSVLQKFFIPVFFCVMGMLVNLQEIFSSKVLLFSSMYLVFAIVGKVFGCGLPALFCNFNLIGATRIGVGMIPRGEVALIIAGIGLSANIIPRDIFSISVMMTLITTLVTPPFLAKLFALDGTGLRKKLKIRLEQTEIQYSMPNLETSELILIRVIEAFKRENFYIYLTEVPEKIYQIRKDQTFIVLKYTPQSLIFSCSAGDSSFIQTLFYDVLVDLEYIIKHLEVLPDKEKIGRSIFENKGKVKNGRVKFSQIINKAAVEINLKGNTKEEIMRELVDVLARSGQLGVNQNKDKILKDLLERELIISTGMQDGIALPHVKTDEVSHLVSAIGIKKAGVDFNSLDKKPSLIFVITLVPRAFAYPYLKHMAEVANFLMSDENRQKMLSCRSNEDLYKVLISNK
ncbi:MAG: cation:proton antiporter [Candidatus Omnitrophota bacterium]